MTGRVKIQNVFHMEKTHICEEPVKLSFMTVLLPVDHLNFQAKLITLVSWLI